MKVVTVASESGTGEGLCVTDVGSRAPTGDGPTPCHCVHSLHYPLGTTGPSPLLLGCPRSGPVVSGVRPFGPVLGGGGTSVQQRPVHKHRSTRPFPGPPRGESRPGLLDVRTATEVLRGLGRGRVGTEHSEEAPGARKVPHRDGASEGYRTEVVVDRLCLDPARRSRFQYRCIGGRSSLLRGRVSGRSTCTSGVRNLLFCHHLLPVSSRSQWFGSCGLSPRLGGEVVHGLVPKSTGWRHS